MNPSDAIEDDVIRLAPTPGALVVPDVPAVKFGRDETSIRSLSEQSVRVTTMTSPVAFETGSLPSGEPPAHRYEITLAARQARIHNGEVYNDYDSKCRPIPYLHDKQSLFDNVTLQGERFAGQHSAQVTKARYRAARVNTVESELAEIDAPYVSVKDRNIEAHLCHIAKLFQYIDNGSAEYFHIGNVEKKQTQSQNHADSPINFGDLGNFCEKVFDRHATGDRGYVLYNITDCTQEELLHYLQDSFEIPYWQLMLYLFLQQNVNSRSLSGTVVFRVLSRLKIEILHKRDVKPLMRGIDARIAVLEDVWHKDTSAFEASELFQAPFRTPDSDQSCSSPNEEPAMPVKAFPTWPKDQQSNPKDTIIFIALIALFAIGSLIPGYKAFSIAINAQGTGSISDADFWNLLQNSAISVLGSMMTVGPFMRGSCFTSAYTVTWFLWGSGRACALISAIIYSFCNTAWSSAVSYFGSLFSLMVVLATTQVVPKPVVSVGDKTK